MTPLTDRALLSLTLAMKNFYCGTLIGPAGVGKSETVKELSKVRHAHRSRATVADSCHEEFLLRHTDRPRGGREVGDREGA